MHKSDLELPEGISAEWLLDSLWKRGNFGKHDIQAVVEARKARIIELQIELDHLTADGQIVPDVCHTLNGECGCAIEEATGDHARKLTPPKVKPHKPVQMHTPVPHKTTPPNKIVGGQIAAHLLHVVPPAQRVKAKAMVQIIKEKKGLPAARDWLYRTYKKAEPKAAKTVKTVKAVKSTTKPTAKPVIKASVKLSQAIKSTKTSVKKLAKATKSAKRAVKSAGRKAKGKGR